MDTKDIAIEDVSKKIAGEIVLSEDPGKTIQKWRNLFNISQRQLSDAMGIMPSVISDYENSRRKSPGIKIINRLVKAIVDIDVKRGGNVVKEFDFFPAKNVLEKAVVDMKEFSVPIKIKSFCDQIDSKLIVRKDLEESKINGYTVVDTLKAIVNLSPIELVKLYGLTNERALVFLDSRSGRTVMVALKVTNLRPRLVVLQGEGKIDELAQRIGEIENIAICKTNLSKDGILKKLKHYNKK